MLALLALWLACWGECDDAHPCAVPTDICAANLTCQPFVCGTSIQCPMETHCQSNACLPGCLNDDDCRTGFACNNGTCENIGCTSTTIDCEFRQFCNVGTGECFDAGPTFCKRCDEDFECGDGNICYQHGCGVDCSGRRECPNGFECTPFTDVAGNVVAFQCITICELFGDFRPGGL